jgi:nitrite reductase/ring-hydroxylating ferredoxin subunit/DMSO/TMAO reductase YedYZ heme-binding membrane subunit
VSVAYRAVQWNRHKRVYDTVLAVGVVAYIGVFVGVGMMLWPGDAAAHPVTLLMRATSTCAITLLTLILAIGPLARLSPRFNPLLYNRRHMGVTMFLVALAHAVIAVFWYHGFGVVNPIVSVFTSNANYLPDRGQGWRGWLAGFPYQPLGVFALTALFLMAATSHDFWLKNLSPRTWKNLHSLVYPAYGLLVMHVTLGFLQDGVGKVYPALLGASALMIVVLHLLAGIKESRREGSSGAADGHGWTDVAGADAIPDGRARVVCLQGRERIAVFRYGNKVSAVSNVCAHQNGPLGEGKVVDGCITCPWHGYQYRPHNGQSPPPFNEKIQTYPVRIVGKRIQINPTPNEPGAEVDPAVIGGDTDA